MRDLKTILICASAVVAGCDSPEDVETSESMLSLTDSNFEIDSDANLKRDNASPSIDWASVTEIRRNDLATGQNDDSYQGGSKEDDACPATTTGSIPNNKSDLLTFGVYQEPGPTSDHPGFLHVFWTRVQEPSGTTLMDFEFNQSATVCGANAVNKVRTEGDFLLEYRLEQGGATATIKIREWDGSAWGTATDVTATGDAIGTINNSPIAAADSDGLITSGSISARTFGEASLDLSVIFDPTKCESFGSAMVKSRASDSFTSQLKDYIAPLGVNISNCGKVIIRKETDPSGLTEEFTYNHTVSTSPSSGTSFTLTDGENETFNNVLFGTGYTVTEQALTGFDLSEIDCSASSGVTVQTNVATGTITFDIDDETDIVDCTYVNRSRGTIIVEKVTSALSGSFDFTSTTLTPSAFTLTTTSAGTAGKDSQTFSDLVPGTYDVAETVPTGWDLASATCDDGSSPASIDLSGGETVTCTFVDAPETGAIVITKTRKHAASGAGDHPHFGVQFDITGGDIAMPISVYTDAAGKACLDGRLLSAFAGVGAYTVTEVVPAGYVSDDASKDVSVTFAASCPDGDPVSFANTPLTDITVSVNSQVDGGTASTIDCGGTNTASTGANGDGSLSLLNLPPGTYTCTVVVDP